MADDKANSNETEYVTTYRPSLLQSLSRQEKRESLGIAEGDKLPFRGVDIWNAYEFSWLNEKGKPEVAVAQFQVPAKSAHIVESKSLKFYLGSFSNTRFGTRAEVISTLESDLSVSAQSPVSVSLLTPEHVVQSGIGTVNGTNLDNQDIEFGEFFWDPAYLEVQSDTIVRESLVSNVFKSLCPITGQPDFATVQIQYSGRSINHEGLLRYLVSYRMHAEFAEQVTERIFVDIMNRCEPDRLTVQSYFTRRGGIDIGAYRSQEDAPPTEVRAWRQ